MIDLNQYLIAEEGFKDFINKAATKFKEKQESELKKNNMKNPKYREKKRLEKEKAEAKKISDEKYNNQILNITNKANLSKFDPASINTNDKLVKLITADIRKLVNTMKSDAEINKALQEDIYKYLDQYEDDNLAKTYQELWKNFDLTWDGEYFILWEGDQSENMVMCRITEMIIDILKPRYKEIPLNFGLEFGDGDEGCLYVFD